ncbi:hypothetical protein [Acetobacter sp. UBA5411]|uniref:hypothetical protein n=1 Tax=Acetobacter sp. UBA5411 TaxID=1945905 RepID=UPI0025C1B7A5|nr:hypothetical protein [Acetobacter sp. UBA5411]
MSGSEVAILNTGALVPSEVFREGGIEKLLSDLESNVRAIPTDATTEKGRKQIKSIAFQVSRSKTALENMGNDLKADAKKTVDLVNADLRIVRDRCDKLRDEVRAPVDEYEARETARTDAHKSAIQEIEALSRFDENPSVDIVKGRLDRLTELSGRDFEEFSARAKLAVTNVTQQLEAQKEAAIARDAREKEERRLAQEAKINRRLKQEAEQREREKRIAERAAEEARIAAEEKAAREKRELELQALAEKNAKERAERQARQDAEQAEKDRVAAVEKARRDKEAAVQAERDRIAKEEADRLAEEKRRAANRAHCAKTNGEIVADLSAIGLTEDQAKAVVVAIAKNTIRHVSIQY